MSSGRALPRRARGLVGRRLSLAVFPDAGGLERQIERGVDFETFFAEAPAFHPNASLIQGVVCGLRVEAVEDPLMRKIRQLDKLVDELAKGRKMEKILRGDPG